VERGDFESALGICPARAGRAPHPLADGAPSIGQTPAIR